MTKVGEGIRPTPSQRERPKNEEWGGRKKEIHHEKKVGTLQGM